MLPGRREGAQARAAKTDEDEIVVFLMKNVGRGEKVAREKVDDYAQRGMHECAGGRLEMIDAM